MQLATRPSRIARTLAAAGVAATLSAAAASALAAQKGLSSTERKIRSSVERHREAQVDFLERVVNINSGTLNVEGVRRVGEVFRAALDSLGFETRWAEMPESMNRAGHLIAEHEGKPGGRRVLLIGHFDTVFEGEGEQFVWTGWTASAPMASARIPRTRRPTRIRCRCRPRGPLCSSTGSPGGGEAGHRKSCFVEGRTALGEPLAAGTPLGSGEFI